MMERFNMTYYLDMIASYMFVTLGIISIYVAPVLIIFLIVFISINTIKADKNIVKTIKVLSKILAVIFVLDLMLLSYIWLNIGRFY